jgi:hypothetical protein
MDFVGFEVLTALKMNSIICCDMTPYRVVDVYKHFIGTYFLHLQGLKVSQIKQPAKIQQ